MLRRLGFGNKWHSWMKKSYGIATFSILLNGTSVEFFHASRGLRQGDPLSPFLFLIVAMAFSALLSKAFQSGLLKGFRIKNNGAYGHTYNLLMIPLFCVKPRRSKCYI